METVSVRTITEIIDVETGELLHIDDYFFRQNEAYLFLLRRRLYEYAYLQIGQPKYVCAVCGQPVVLLGKKTKRGQVAYFAHYKDSDDCPIKTHGGEMSEEDIKRCTYIGETERHLEIKHQISSALETSHINNMPFSHIKEEERIASKLDFRSWAVPDVYAECGDLKINFEVQLSTIFLSTIIERDVYYRLHGIFLIWVFAPGAVNEGTISMKDIVWTNNGNMFIYDHIAHHLTQQTGELTLLCRWYEWVEGDMDAVRLVSGKYVSLSNLTFDRIANTVYYVDVASRVEECCPGYKKDRREMEQMELEALDEFRVKLDGATPTKEEVIEGIKSGLYKPRWVKKGNHYGYAKYGHTIIPFIYTHAEEFVDNVAIVRRDRRYGLVNVFGVEIAEVKYKSYEILDKYIKLTNDVGAISILVKGIPHLFYTTINIEQQINNIENGQYIDEVNIKEIVDLLEECSSKLYEKGVEYEKGGKLYIGRSGTLIPTKPDFYKARGLYRTAANMGYAPALNKLGLYYAQGAIVDKDLQKAVEYYRQSAEQGYASAQWNLALCYEKGEVVEKDYEQAFQWLNKAAEQENKEAQNRLGIYYKRGLGVEKNLQQAVEYYHKSAEQGYASAQWNLALCYEKGEGVKKSYEQAFKWLKKAAEQGNMQAQKKLGDYYQQGLGVETDTVKALEWHQKAEEQEVQRKREEVQRKREEHLKKLRENENSKRCPWCGNILKVRTGYRGPFYGCNNFPKCKYTEDITFNSDIKQ